MSFTTPQSARPRLVSTTRLHLPSSPERPLSGRTAVSSSPVRTLSGGYASALSRPPAALATTPAFEPRVIRATPSPTRGGEPGCAPVPTSTSPVATGRTHRPSVRTQSTTVAHVAVPNTPRSTTMPAPVPAPPAPAAFPRPAYLNHSALRDLLYTDASSVQPGSSHLEHVLAGGPGPASSRMSTPVPIPYPYLRHDTPGLDTDDDSMASASPPPARATPAPPAPGALLSNPALRLPTRWSEQDRHNLLTVSGDGRELTFYGAYCVSFLKTRRLLFDRPVMCRRPRLCGCSRQPSDPACMWHILLRS